MDLIHASAPSNIALIKYMGKVDNSGNRPTNASVSFTLDGLRTFVTLERGAPADRWEPLPGHPALTLSELGREKFLKHFAKLKAHFGVEEACVVRSANDFPSDCGLASSASSFAALTRAAFLLAKEIRPELEVDDRALSALSRQGSGSSCRSFFAPWALWRDEGAEPIAIDQRLVHAVIVVEDRVKTVSSSQAHRRVTTSDLFEGRPQRAERRLDRLVKSLRAGTWDESFELCWAEFWDMHALFETSVPSFGYMHPETLRALARVREIWRDEKDGPLVTLDAGPNVHLLLRPDQTETCEGWLEGFTALRSWDR